MLLAWSCAMCTRLDLQVFLPRFVITHVIILFNGIWRHHLLSNKVGRNSFPLDNIHFKFSVICVRFMYKYLTLCYIFFLFLIWRRLSFFKTFLVTNKAVQNNQHFLFNVYCVIFLCVSYCADSSVRVWSFCHSDLTLPCQLFSATVCLWTTLQLIFIRPCLITRYIYKQSPIEYHPGSDNISSFWSLYFASSRKGIYTLHV